jgi:hypothetical protein
MAEIRQLAYIAQMAPSLVFESAFHDESDTGAI